MAYLKIHSRDWVNNYTGAINYPLKLRVIQGDSVEVTPSENVKVTELKKGNDNKLYKHFLNTGDGGITFKIKIIIGRNDRWSIRLFDKNGKTVLDKPLVTTILKKFYNEMTVLQITTDFIDVPSENYIITKNPSRTQSFQDYTIWELEFTTYRAINTVKYANNNSAVQNAIAKAKKQNAKKTTTKKTTKSSSSKNKKLASCKLSQMKYSKKKKVVTCNKYMQEVLYKKGFLTKKQVDGWYGDKTVAAVKKFQKKYKKTYNLKVTGKMDKNTLNAMCKV